MGKFTEGDSFKKSYIHPVAIETFSVRSFVIYVSSLFSLYRSDILSFVIGGTLKVNKIIAACGFCHQRILAARQKLCSLEAECLLLFSLERYSEGKSALL